MAPTSTGPHRRPPNKQHESLTRFPPTAGSKVPAGTLALARSPQALRGPLGQSALHTLIRQRHLTPSCGRPVLTAERTLDPARMCTESLTPNPELENAWDVRTWSASARRSRHCLSDWDVKG